MISFLFQGYKCIWYVLFFNLSIFSKSSTFEKHSMILENSFLIIIVLTSIVFNMKRISHFILYCPKCGYFKTLNIIHHFSIKRFKRMKHKLGKLCSFTLAQLNY